MPLQSSGLIKLSQIQSEFGGSDPISLTEYYRNGAYVTANNTGVPTSGVISVTSFYGTGRAFYLTISSNTQNANIASLATAAGWNGSDYLDVTVNSSVYLWSDTTSTAGAIISGSFPNGLILQNYGKIIGKGGQGGNNGNGNGYAGGPALSIASSNVTINNLSGAYIAGGGGGGKAFSRAGGGGGAGGGRGGNSEHGSGGAGGALGQMGASGSGWASPDSSKGGSAGGQGGYEDESSSGTEYGSGGGGGGRILPGTTSPSATAGRSTLWAAGRGGAGGVAGGSRAQEGAGLRGGGGGGWGAPGGSSGGGAAGKAIEPNGNAYTLNDSGTIFGATT